MHQALNLHGFLVYGGNSSRQNASGEPRNWSRIVPVVGLLNSAVQIRIFCLIVYHFLPSIFQASISSLCCRGLKDVLIQFTEDGEKVADFQFASPSQWAANWSNTFLSSHPPHSSSSLFSPVCFIEFPSFSFSFLSVHPLVLKLY